MIVGISGYARSGKNEAATALVGLGFKQVAFADTLREFLLALNPMVGLRLGAIRVSDVIAEYGWDGYKSSPYGKEMRELMQRLGTDCGREMIHDRVWIDAAFNKGGRDMVIPDVRFPNEARAIHEHNGIVLRIERPGVGPANSHPSETALDDWKFDAVIKNNSTIGELHRRVLHLTKVAGSSLLR